MEELNRIFKQLDSNQIKISAKPVSLTKSSLINLDSYTKYNFNENYDYKHSIWFILYYLKNQIDDKTYIEQNTMFKKTMMEQLEAFSKEKKSKLYDRKELSNSIQKMFNSNKSIFLIELTRIEIQLKHSNLSIFLPLDETQPDEIHCFTILISFWSKVGSFKGIIIK